MCYLLKVKYCPRWYEKNNNISLCFTYGEGNIIHADMWAIRLAGHFNKFYNPVLVGDQQCWFGVSPSYCTSWYNSTGILRLVSENLD